MAVLSRCNQNSSRRPESRLWLFEGVQIHQPINGILHSPQANRFHHGRQCLRESRVSFWEEWFWRAEDAKRVEMLAGEKSCSELRAAAGSFIERNAVPLLAAKRFQEHRGACLITAECR